MTLPGSMSGKPLTAGQLGAVAERQRPPEVPSRPVEVPPQPEPGAMTGEIVLGPLEIARRMEQCMSDLDRLLAETTEEIETLADDRRNYEVGFAQARIHHRSFLATAGIKVTVDAVDDHATVETADLKHHLILSEERLKATNAARRAVESKLDTLRSMNASLRSAGG